MWTSDEYMRLLIVNSVIISSSEGQAITWTMQTYRLPFGPFKFQKWITKYLYVFALVELVSGVHIYFLFVKI